jgi:hypothetical protein
VLTSEQITAVGCDPDASKGQMKRCFATVIGCDPPDTELKMIECMKAKIENTLGDDPPGFDCGPIEGEGAESPNEIAGCMVGKIQAGKIPGGE